MGIYGCYNQTITPEIPMSAESEREAQRLQRLLERMTSDYAPLHHPSIAVPPEQRLANAAEYAAFQLGQINRNLDLLVHILQTRDP